MTICVTATSGNLDAPIDPRFGRCAYFLIVDPDTMNFEAIPNPGMGAMGGAGIQAGQLVANKGVDTVITGSVGPNAYQTLSAAGIKIVSGAYGTVREAIEMYKSGKLGVTGGATVVAHAGMGAGSGMGVGMGGGRGMGRGGGRGMGQGMFGMQQPIQPISPMAPSTSAQLVDQRIQGLERQMKDLGKDLKKIKKMLEDLKG